MKVVSEFESEMATLNFNLNGTQDSLKTLCVLSLNFKQN